MATYSTAIFELQDPDRVNTSRLAAANEASGDLEVATFQYPLSSGTEEVANDVIKLGIIPVGAIVVPALCTVHSADPGTTLTLDIGYEGNTDAYADGITLSSGGLINFTSGTAPSALDNEPLTAGTTYPDGTVLATVASAGTLTDAVVLTFTIVYRRGKG